MNPSIQSVGKTGVQAPNSSDGQTGSAASDGFPPHPKNAARVTNVVRGLNAVVRCKCTKRWASNVCCADKAAVAQCLLPGAKGVSVPFAVCHDTLQTTGLLSGFAILSKTTSSMLA